MTVKVAEEIVEALKQLKDQRFSDQLIAILDYSNFVNRVFTRYPGQIVELTKSGDLESAYSDAHLSEKIERLTSQISDQTEFEQFIRQIRHLEMTRIVLREYVGAADIEASMMDLSSLADALLLVTTQKHSNWLIDRYGTPIAESNAKSADFVVFAMGKLGGEELNFSSDIDLIFAYSDIGQTNGNNVISNNEFFIRLGQAVINSLDKVTADGFVYRVDMRLRPNGQSGPLVMSFSAMENYYQIHGREWERYAWIKARIVAGNKKSGEYFLKQLRPFIYRKYLDYQVYESLEEMKAMINKEIRQQGLEQNIKLGKGGIREIEFIAQSHQLVRGGREPELRTRHLRKALFSLSQSRQIKDEIVIKLYRAYLFLRTVEHRLQIKNDQQIHLLPDSRQEYYRLAASLGYDSESFEKKLCSHREFIHSEFIKLHNTSQVEQIDNDWQLLWRHIVSGNWQADQLNLDKELATALKAYANSKAYRALESKGRRIVDRLMPKVLKLISEDENSLQTLNRTLSVLSAIGGRSAYLSLLDQFPVAARQLIQLCASSPWISQWIADHPIVLDTLINPRSDLYIFNNDIEQEITRRVDKETDDELKHDILRQIHHSSILQIAIADLQHQYEVTEIRRFISRTAQVIVNQVVSLCQRELKEKFGLPKANGDVDYFGIIAYGKLGSSELSYNADLDLVFIYDDQVLSQQTQGGRKSVRVDYYFSRLVQRILTMLSMQTAAGKLYDVDTRLRPSGQSGLLVCSLTQYRKYQNEQAWTWEHQALVKARMISNTPMLQKKFDQIREQVLSNERQENELKQDITSMRNRMREAGNQKSNFNEKTDPGGMIDIEFIAQYIVLNYGRQHAELIESRSIEEIMLIVTQKRLMKTTRAKLLSKTYSDLLQLENQHKLHSKVDQNNHQSLNQQMDNVQLCWNEIFTQG